MYFSSLSTAAAHQWIEIHETVPHESSDKFPKIVGGQDNDPVTRQRRDKIKQVSLFYFFLLRFLFLQRITILCKNIFLFLLKFIE